MNKPDAPIDTAPASAVVEVPPADPDWHPIALRWYESLASSGQAVFYEPSDWLTAYAVAESMSREFKPQPVVAGAKLHMLELPPKASALSAWLRASAVLMATEGDRRRLRLELERPQSSEEAADVAWIDDARNRLRSG